MKALKARVSWMKEYANNPGFEVLVDKIPESTELRYKCINRIYYAEKAGYVSFYYYNSPGEGFGGSHFHITMDDESEMILKGPWSSRSGCANKYFPHCMEIALIEEESGFDRGYTFYSCAATIEWVTTNVLPLLPGVSIIAALDHGELSYHPTFQTKPIKCPWSKVDPKKFKEHRKRLAYYRRKYGK